MELTPQTLHAVEFREARRGGYNTRDVDDFLERVAQGVDVLHSRLRDVMLRAESAEGRVAEAHRQLEEAHRRPPVEVSETDDTLRRTLVLAQRTADATIKEAKDEAARLLSEAREESTRTRAEAEAEARRGTEGARAQAEAEIERLLDTRDSLKRDIDALGDRMRDQRERLRKGIAELERALEDPTVLEPAPPIPLTQVDNPGQTGRHTRVELPGPPPAPAPAIPPALPMRTPGASSVSGMPSDDDGLSNGQPHEPAVPFLPGTQVASLQEAPALPSRPRPDLAPVAPAQAQGGPFAFNGAPEGYNGAPEGYNGGSDAFNRAPEGYNGGSDAMPSGNPGPWPSQLRTSLGDEPNGALGRPGSNGADPLHSDDIGIEPGSRPSEWGRPVFDRDDEGEPSSRFGGR